MTVCRNRTVLVVSDHCRQEGSWGDVLGSGSLRTLECAAGRTAIVMAGLHRPDLILVSLEGDDDAHTCIRNFHADPRCLGIPILAIWKQFAPDDLTSPLDDGPDDYLLEPFTSPELLTRIDFIIRSARARRERLGRRPDSSDRMAAMSILQGFHEEIIGHDDIETTCRRSVETAARLVDSDRVSLLLSDRRSHCMRFVHAVGIDESLWNGRQVALSSPVAGRVLASQREIVVNQATAWPRQGRYAGAQFVSMPLVGASDTGGRTILGVLNVTERRGGQDFADQDVLALRQLARATAFSIDAIRTRRRLDASRDAIILSLARLSEYRHAPTGKHLERVRELSLLLARHLADDPRVSERIDAQFLSDLGRAAPLHDVGKVAIPDRILLKEGRLTPEEFRVIKGHTRIGAAALDSVAATCQDDTFLKMAMDIAHGHHERFDGTGYPQGLAGREIPLSARIVCLADSYDAIRTAREYKPARPHEEAVSEMLAGAGKQFDPLVVEAFCALEGRFDQIYNNLMEERRASGNNEDALVPVGACLPSC
jgi:response regulator RpfG family c-di-GMP phosphodiesterase